MHLGLRTSHRIATALALIGTSTPAFAQNDREKATERRQQRDASPVYVAGSDLLDARATSDRDPDNAADIDDLVVNTRNGRVVYAIIDTNEILGSENKVVAIPYGALDWKGADEGFALHVTADELKNLPTFDPNDLAHLQDESWNSTMRGIFGDRRELRDNEKAADAGDEYTRYFLEGDAKTFRCRVMSVDQVATMPQGAKLCSIVVIPEEGVERRTVLLAPAPYLKEQACLPSDGDVLAVTAIPSYGADGKIAYVAQRIERGDKKVRLRDENGVPRWASGKETSARRLYALASTLDDGSLYVRGEEFGSVSDTVFEARSGTAAFAIISVGGVLGVDDTLYPVPCGAFTLGEESSLHVEGMPIDELTHAPKLSEEGTADLNDREFAATVYEYFGGKAKDFNVNRARDWRGKAEERKREGRPSGTPGG